jgi:TatA/E family protein of Tat protein translocase
MGSLGGAEILVILVVALLVLGPERLPEAARQVGRVMAELRRMSSGFQAEIRDAMQTPLAGPTVPPASPPTPPPATPAPQEQKFLWSDLPTSADDPST